MDDSPKKSAAKAGLANILNNPVQLRVLLAVSLLGTWYFLVSSPTTAEIDGDGKKAAREARRIGLACDIERLRDHLKRFEGRVPKDSDPNEWVQYMLAGLRTLHVKFDQLDTDAPKELGPYRVIPIKVEVEGDFREIGDFLRWIETNERLLRVDNLKIEPARGGAGRLKASMTVLGVMT